MRIISGKLKRRLINPPKNFKARPTTDVAKEGLFNIIGNNFDIEELDVLDLFGGTGNISYEFASRECKSVTCVEVNSTHFSFIQKTVRDLDLSSQVKVNKSNVFVYLKRVSQQFDFIFADPPYEMEGIDTIPDLVFDNDRLAKEGWLIVEHSERTSFLKHPKFFQIKKYGKVNFSFFKV